MNQAVLFNTGEVVITATAKHILNSSDVIAAYMKHIMGDWGNVCDEDKKENDRAIRNGTRIMSSYQDKTGQEFWIITEWDRSYTTILLPEEY